MRILQFSDSFLPIMDGVGNVVYQYALHMGQKGHEVSVVAPLTDTGYRGGYPFEIVDYIGVPLPHMKSYTLGAPILDRHCLARLKHVKADIVHVHSPFMSGQSGIQHAQRLGLPIVGTFHSKYYDDFLQVTGVELLANAGVKYVVNFYNKCDQVWAVSTSSADTLRSYGYKGDIRVMPNGCDVHPATPDETARARARFALTDGASVLLYVGQLNWKKNLRCVLEAFAGLAQPCRLVLAGQGPHEKELHQLCQALDIQDRVCFAGHLTDQALLNGLYAAADVFVFPSLYDTFGLVTHEAAAQGTPSVVVRDSSAAECIEDGVNGFLCQNSPASLRAVLSGALADHDRLRRIGQRALQTLPVPWSRLVDDVLKVYEAIIADAKEASWPTF